MERLMPHLEDAAAHTPDCIWQKDGILDEAWGAPSNHSGDYQNAQKLMRHGSDEAKTFFRYPPITVVLRRKATNTIYVVTTIHTPGTNDGVKTTPKPKADGKKEKKRPHSDQRKLEVEWLMTPKRYDAVIEGLLNNGPPKVKEAGTTEMMHLICGDFNAHLLNSGTRSNTSIFGPWLEFCGSAEERSVLTLKEWLRRRGLRAQRLDGQVQRRVQRHVHAVHALA
jgi:hypothetical protein